MSEFIDASVSTQYNYVANPRIDALDDETTLTKTSTGGSGGDALRISRTKLRV